MTTDVQEIGKDLRAFILGHLELLADPQEIRDYQRRVPVADVYAEIFVQWFDDANLDALTSDAGKSADDLTMAALSSAMIPPEILGVQRFHQTFGRVAAETPDRMGLEDFLKSNQYAALRAAAKELLSLLRPTAG